MDWGTWSFMSLMVNGLFILYFCSLKDHSKCFYSPFVHSAQRFSLPVIATPNPLRPKCELSTVHISLPKKRDECCNVTHPLSPVLPSCFLLYFCKDLGVAQLFLCCLFRPTLLFCWWSFEENGKVLTVFGCTIPDIIVFILNGKLKIKDSLICQTTWHSVLWCPCF